MTNNTFKSFTSVATMAILILSSAVVIAMGSPGKTSAQQANDTFCEKLNVASASESGHTGESYDVSKIIDNDPISRWSSKASGSYAQVDLGKSVPLCSVDIKWYRGELRSYNFVISVSNDGVKFKDLVSGKSTGETSSAERYNLPDSNAKFVRVTVFGNTENSYASIYELAVNGEFECKAPLIDNVTASGDDGNIAQNTIDSNLNTRWSNLGHPSSIQYELGESQPICNVDIAWYRGNLRVNTFTISVSNDGTNFTPVFSGKSSGETIGLVRYDVQDTIGKYMRITVTGNTENRWSSISEVRINGGAIMECKSPRISGISASGNQQGNTPQNTFDNSLNTRWSNLGLPSSIQYDLGESQPICNVDIAWYRGNLRVNTFTISVSNDGTNFTPIFSGQSSGETMGLERFNVPDTIAKYMRITVTGNTENSWSSITEVKINGGGIPDPGPDPDPDPDPDPTPTPGTDRFGIQKIYPTKIGGEEWFMDMTDGQDTRSRPPSMTKNSDGSFKVTSSQVRYGVFTSDGYQPEEVELDHGILAERGYMQSPKDWKNVELTGYVKVNSGQSGENFAWYARGGRHTGSGSPEGCEGSAYKPDLYYDGRVRFSKEQWHVSYDFTDHKRPISSIEDRWVGFKGLMWNMEQNGETVVKMEIWVDDNKDGKQDGPWVKVDENIDSGGWGSEGEECDGDSDQIITWGGPIATFRWDGATNVDIKNFSVREIQPPS